jgi:hypothetical protein
MGILWAIVTLLSHIITRIEMSRSNEVSASANTFAFGEKLAYQNVEMRVKLHMLLKITDQMIASLVRNEPARLKVEGACNARPTSFYI